MCAPLAPYGVSSQSGRGVRLLHGERPLILIFRNHDWPTLRYLSLRILPVASGPIRAYLSWGYR